MSLSTPVALFIFKRPDLTELVLGAIAQAKPRKLFVVADGPRNEAEKAQCESARAVIQKVDWDCEVLTNFSDTNLRGPWRVSSGISWVFSQVEEAIILEDDCVPSQSFFPYCEELLGRYRDDERIMHVSGGTFHREARYAPYSYGFSKYCNTWGWATWRRAWRHFDLYMKTWPALKDTGLAHNLFDTRPEEEYWSAVFDKCVFEADVHWDMAWLYTCWTQHGLSISPAVNMISNRGFRPDATHTQDVNGTLANLPLQEIGALQHPPFVVRDREGDVSEFRRVFQPEVETYPRPLRRLRRGLSALKQTLRL